MCVPLSLGTLIHLPTRQHSIRTYPTLGAHQSTGSPRLRAGVHPEVDVPARGDIGVLEDGALQRTPIYGDALDVRLAGRARGGDYQRLRGVGQVDGDFVEEGSGVRVGFSMYIYRRRAVHSRSDDVLSGNRVDGVEPERTEDVPRAHLSTVFILRYTSISTTVRDVREDL